MLNTQTLLQVSYSESSIHVIKKRVYTSTYLELIVIVNIVKVKFIFLKTVLVKDLQSNSQHIVVLVIFFSVWRWKEQNS